jgi:hypothetical protein
VAAFPVCADFLSPIKTQIFSMRNQFNIVKYISIRRFMTDTTIGHNLSWLALGAAFGLTACAPASAPSAFHPMLALPPAEGAIMDAPKPEWWKRYKDV